MTADSFMVLTIGCLGDELQVFQQQPLSTAGHEPQLPALKQFILPGGVPKAAALHLARTVCRRAERAVVRLYREHETDGLSSVVPYLNRLSDLLFVLARVANQAAGAPEVPW